MDPHATIGAKAYNVQRYIRIEHASFVCYDLVVTVEGDFCAKMEVLLKGSTLDCRRGVDGVCASDMSMGMYKTRPDADITG